VTAPTIAATGPHPDRRLTAHGWLRAVQRRSTLTPKARAVAAVLFARMDEDGTCWPSLATIATDAGYVRSHSVLAALDELEAAGWLLRERRRKANGAPATTRYAAVVPAVAVDPDEPVGPPVDPAGRSEVPNVDPNLSSAELDLAADTLRSGELRVVDNRPAVVDATAGGYPSHGVTVTPGRGPELASELATDQQQPRPHARRRRRRGRPPGPAPSWRSVTAPDGRVYAVDGADSADGPLGSPLRSPRSLVSHLRNGEGGGS
jgi:hypothetical protein